VCEGVRGCVRVCEEGWGVRGCEGASGCERVWKGVRGSERV